MYTSSDGQRLISTFHVDVMTIWTYILTQLALQPVCRNLACGDWKHRTTKLFASLSPSNIDVVVQKYPSLEHILPHEQHKRANSAAGCWSAASMSLGRSYRSLFVWLQKSSATRIGPKILCRIFLSNTYRAIQKKQKIYVSDLFSYNIFTRERFLLLICLLRSQQFLLARVILPLISKLTLYLLAAAESRLTSTFINRRTF